MNNFLRIFPVLTICLLVVEMVDGDLYQPFIVTSFDLGRIDNHNVRGGGDKMLQNFYLQKLVKDLNHQKHRHYSSTTTTSAMSSNGGGGGGGLDKSRERQQIKDNRLNDKRKAAEMLKQLLHLLRSEKNTLDKPIEI